METTLEECRKKGGVVGREEMRKEMERDLRKKDERVRLEMGEWAKIVEDREGGVRDAMRKDLEEIVERRESKMRKLMREDVGKMLEEWGKKLEAMRNLAGQGGKEKQEKESGREKGGNRRAETVKAKSRERPEAGGGT